MPNFTFSLRRNTDKGIPLLLMINVVQTRLCYCRFVNVTANPLQKFNKQNQDELSYGHSYEVFF